MSSSPSTSAYLPPSSTTFGPGLARPWRRCAAFLAALLLAALFVPATAPAITYTMYYPEFSWAGGGSNSLNALGGILRLDGVGRLHNRVSGGGALEFYGGDTTIDDAKPDFSGRVLLRDSATVKLKDRLGLGSDWFNTIDLQVGTELTLDYADSDLYLPRRLSGGGKLYVANGKSAGLLPGSSDYAGMVTLNQGSSLHLLGLGADAMISAAGTGDIILDNNAYLHLVNGGILKNQLHGTASSRLVLDANRYTLLDNNIRATATWDGAVEINSQGELTLKADLAQGADASPEFAVSGGNLVLDGPEVTFGDLTASGLQLRLTDKTALDISDTTFSNLSYESIFLDGREAALNLSGGFTLDENLRGTGQVRFDNGAFTLSGNNTWFMGEFALAGNTVLELGATSQIGDLATLRFNSGTLSLTRPLTLANPIILESGGGILDTARESLVVRGITGSGDLEKIGAGQLTLISPTHSYTGETRISAGELRLADSNLSGTSGAVVASGATLSGSGGVAGRTEVSSGGTLSVDGLLSFGGDLELATGSDLIFNNAGQLAVGGALTWGNLNNLATINMDSFGAYKLADYGSTNLASGVVDGAHYTLSYNGVRVQNDGDYRVVLDNHDASNQLALLFMPTGTKLAYWAKDADGLWETDGEFNWNTNFNPAAGSSEAWATDSRAAVFGASGVSPHAVTLRGPVSASGLFFQESGWSIGGDTLTLLDLDPQDGPALYAVIGTQNGLTRVSATLTGHTGLHKSGAGSLLLTEHNTYAGPTKVTAGNLWLGNIRAAGNGGAIEVSEGATLNLVYRDDQTGLPQIVTGDGTLAVNGVARLDKINRHKGGTRLGGTLHLATNGALGEGPLIFQDGRLIAASRRLSSSNLVELSGTTNEIAVAAGNSLTLSGKISGRGAFWKTGAGDLLLSGDNVYGGGTTLAGGRTIVRSNSALGVGTVNLHSAATLVFDTSRALANPFQLEGAGLFEVAAGQAAELNGEIGGAGWLRKSGPGLLTLTESNTHSGPTAVLEGTLALSGRGTISDKLLLHDQSTFDSGGSAVSLALLNVNGQARYVGDLGGGGRKEFVVPAGMAFDGLVMLDVDGQADLDQSLVPVQLGQLAQIGQKATLISSSGGLVGTPLNSVSISNFGISRTYSLDLTQDANNLYATMSGLGASDESKALSTGFISGLTLLNQGSDLAAGPGLREAVASTRRAARFGADGFALAAYGTVSGGWSKYRTGSSAELTSLSLLTGVAWGGEVPGWLMTVGPFFEFGNGSYNTYNSFSRSGDVNGDGDLHYAGGGLLARLDLNGPAGGELARDAFYLEASGRAGGLKNDYANDDLRDPLTGSRADYSTDSVYYSVHAGAGYIRRISAQATLETYGKFFWTRQSGEKVTLDNGDPIDFQSVTSERLRLGGRGTLALRNKPVSLYAGLAWEHEFQGVSRATTYGYDIKEPSLRGDTGIGELGLNLQPTGELPLFVDLGVQGYLGKRRGVSGTLSLKWEF